MHNGKHDVNILKGLVAGLAGGLVASWTMNQFQAAWTRVTENSEKSHGAQSMQPADGSTGDQQADVNEQDDATVETAKVISRNVFRHELQESEKEPAGALVHYAFGTATGGLYGALAEVSPQVTMAAGLPFGAVFLLVAIGVSHIICSNIGSFIFWASLSWVYNSIIVEWFEIFHILSSTRKQVFYLISLYLSS